MHETWTNTETNDAVKTEPGVHSIFNTSTGAAIEATPTKWTIKSGTSADIHVEVVPDKITIKNASGHTLVASIDDGIVITKGANSLTLDLENGVVFVKDGKTAKLTSEQLFIDDGAGNTNSVTSEQMVISGSGKTAVYEANAVTYTQGSSTASVSTGNGLQVIIDGATLSAKPDAVSLDDGEGNSVQITPPTGFLATDSEGQTASLYTDKMQIQQGDDYARVSPAGGLDTLETGYAAKVSAAAGLHLDDGGESSVDIATQSGDAISLQPTAVCADDGTTKTSNVLHGNET